MDSDSFPLFPDLPLELRQLIWLLCLPHRIAEEDTPDDLLDGDECRQLCSARRTTYQNAKPPVIASVNTESRQIALEEGHMFHPQPSTSLVDVWVQPRQDLQQHLNWTPMRSAEYGKTGDEDDLVCMFLVFAKELGMRPSITADIIHPFNLKALLEAGVASDDPSAEQHALWSDNHAVHNIAMCADIEDWADHECLGIAMAAVSLHITEEAALRSGLFGLLGDAPVQMVDYNDKSRLSRFQGLLEREALDKEPAVQKLFATFRTGHFRDAVETWTRQAEWLVLAHMWKLQKGDNDDLVAASAGLAWVPELPEGSPLEMSTYMPDEEHPWVKQAIHKRPKLRPQIMVRYCTNQCYKTTGASS